MSGLVARVHVMLLDTFPLVWRRFEVPITISFSALHEVIQASMGWQHDHCWEFLVGEDCFGELDPVYEDNRTQDARSQSLEAVLNRPLRQFHYRYDFGDNWLHLVSVEGFWREGDIGRFPVFLEGGCCAPPEDCGGSEGFQDFLKIIADPDNETHEETQEWYAARYGHTFDPAFINRPEIELAFNVIGKSPRM